MKINIIKNLSKIFYKNNAKTFLYRFFSFAKLRHKARLLKKFIKIKNINIILIEKEKEEPLSLKNIDKIEKVVLNVIGNFDKTNKVKIHLPQKKGIAIKIWFKLNKNEVVIGENCSGDWVITLAGRNNKCLLGKETSCCAPPCLITLVDGILQIGKNCMFSNNVHIWSDGHSVLDYETKQVLNKPISPIIVGDHCWIGERVTLTKNAQIPNDTIVGIASVVTKKFIEEHTVIAGNPAKVVRTNITWDELSPSTYCDDKRNNENNQDKK